MKRFISAVIILSVLVAALSLVFVNAADGFDYVHIVAGGNDPYGTITFNANGNHTSIDPDAVKFAKIKYRTETEVDNTGVQLKGQFYVNPAAEPFIPVKYNHTKKWETVVVDLTAVSEKTTLSSIWDGSHYSGKTAIRFDPMEPDRDAEDQNNEHNTAVVLPDSAIDIAWIAFFESEADAKAYDGTQNTPYCIILPEDMTDGKWAGANNIKSAAILHQDATAEEPSNPPSGDAMVVAMAAIGCIALAGVVAAKKSK